MNFREIYFSTLCGSSLDFITTTIGLNLGFAEINTNYHPAWAILFYTLTTVIFHLTLPDNIRKVSFIVLVSLSFVAAINNIMVIFGVFSGILF